jgi:hypothetical protein
MIWVLLTAIVAAFAGAGIGLLLRNLSRKRLPTGVIPVCAGLAMLVATIGTEYGWYPNVVDTMAPDLVIITERQQQAWYQPWTFVRPWVRGFVSFSPDETAETAEGSGIYLVQVRIQERWQPQIVLPNLVDCDGARRAEARPETTFSDAGEPIGVTWLDVPPDDPILNAVCSGGAAAS